MERLDLLAKPNPKPSLRRLKSLAGVRLPAAAALLALVGLMPGVARAQLPGAPDRVPQPRIADMNARSGLLTRFNLSPREVLPPDPRRDYFFNTRYGDKAGPWWPNGVHGGGLYGFRWKGQCTSCGYPNFHGSPGRSTMNGDCVPVSPRNRLWANFVHPFKPVGMYYQNGCYVPIYDLDPIVPGPGPFPWPFYYRGPRGG